jgi:CheY-like chemotaxis protein
MSDMTAWGHILVVEDNVVNQRVMRAMLENLGFHVDVVDDGTDAVSAAAVTPYRAILMDCQLPTMDGHLAASEIRRWQGASRRAPIIAVTASENDHEQQRSLAAGMDDFVTKPLTLQMMAEVLARWAPDQSNVTQVETSPTLPKAPVMTEAEVDHELEAEIEVDISDEVLDPDVIERLERLGEATGEDLMAQLTILFLVDADLHLAAIRDGLAAQDVAKVIRSAHTFSGASGNVGASQLASLCADFAADGTISDPAASTALLRTIETELGRVRIALGARTGTS